MLIRSALYGFSLVELMIGLAVVGIVIMLGLPAYTHWIQNLKIRNAAESVLHGLQLARAEAIRSNTNVSFVLGAGTLSDWTVSVVAPVQVIQTRSAAQGSDTVLVTRTPATSTTVTFDSLGRAALLNAAAPVVPFTQLDFDVPTTIMPASESRNLRITIGTGGNVRMCDPTVAVVTDPRYC